MEKRYAWKQNSKQHFDPKWKLTEKVGEGVNNNTLYKKKNKKNKKNPSTSSSPQLWVYVSLRQNHTNTQNHITIHPVKNNISSIQSGQIDLWLFHCSIHSFLKQHTAVTTWRQKENVLPVLGFTTMSWFQSTWGGQRNSYYGITFENRTLKGLYCPILKTRGLSYL